MCMVLYFLDKAPVYVCFISGAICIPLGAFLIGNSFDEDYSRVSHVSTPYNPIPGKIAAAAILGPMGWFL